VPGILRGLDQHQIIEVQDDEDEKEASGDDTSRKRSHSPCLTRRTTRQRVHGRPANQLFDTKYHPMDDVLRPQTARKHRERLGLSEPSDSEEGEEGYVSLKSDSDSDEEPPTKRARLPRSRGTRASSRLKTQPQPLYDTSRHPQDRQLRKVLGRSLGLPNPCGKQKRGRQSKPTSLPRSVPEKGRHVSIASDEVADSDEDMGSEQVSDEEPQEGPEQEQESEGEEQQNDIDVCITATINDIAEDIGLDLSQQPTSESHTLHTDDRFLDEVDPADANSHNAPYDREQKKNEEEDNASGDDEERDDELCARHLRPTNQSDPVARRAAQQLAYMFSSQPSAGQPTKNLRKNAKRQHEKIQIHEDLAAPQASATMLLTGSIIASNDYPKENRDPNNVDAPVPSRIQDPIFESPVRRAHQRLQAAMSSPSRSGIHLPTPTSLASFRQQHIEDGTSSSNPLSDVLDLLEQSLTQPDEAAVNSEVEENLSSGFLPSEGQADLLHGHNGPVKSQKMAWMQEPYTDMSLDSVLGAEPESESIFQPPSDQARQSEPTAKKASPKLRRASHSAVYMAPKEAPSRARRTNTPSSHSVSGNEAGADTAIASAQSGVALAQHGSTNDEANDGSSTAFLEDAMGADERERFQQAST
jgi:hypothetical protein